MEMTLKDLEDTLEDINYDLNLGRNLGADYYLVDINELKSILQEVIRYRKEKKCTSIRKR
jgi:hypothetical protein